MIKKDSLLVRKITFIFGINLICNSCDLCCFQGGFFASARPVQLLKTGTIDLLPLLKDDAIPLVDAISPTDFILNSPLGMSDGQVYKHLQSILWQSSDTFQRPKW